MAVKEDYPAQDFSFRDSDFYEDEGIYPQFKECEAEEIVYPLEYDLLTNADESALSKKEDIPISSTAFSFYLFTEAIGKFTVDCFKFIFLKILPVFILPLTAIFKALSPVFKKLTNFIKSGKIKKLLTPSLFKDIKNIKRAAEKRQQDQKKFFIKNTARVFYAKISHREGILTTAFNLIVPTVAVLALLFLYNSTKNQIFALEVIYNGESIGYVENQDTFESGKNEALSLLSTSKSDTVEIKQPIYKISRISISKLSNSSMISEQLISKQDTSYIRACGIYIDGEFLCAVKNESDAESVFASLLKPYKKNITNGTMVSFVEEIEYVQGYYEEKDGVIWDTQKLKNTLNTPKTKKKIYTVKKGDSAKSVAKKFKLTVKQLKAMNPGKDFSKFKEIKKLVVAQETNYVRVKVMKTSTRTQAIKYETIERNSSTLAKGTKKTTQNGQNGEKLITELITYIDGVKSYTSLISEKQTKAPVNKIVLVGTKTASSVSSSVSSSGSYYPMTSYRQFIWPTKGAYAVSSHYGYRSAKISGWSYHGGIDIVLGSGSSAGIPIVASASGTVVIANSGWSGYGHTVVIDHGNGYRTRYAHMYPRSITVRVGQRVYQGQQIGRIGSTGNSTGPHLHFEILINGRKTNPYPYIR